MVQILLVDDHPLFRKGLRLLLEQQADLQIVGEAGNGREALANARELTPDVVIMDIAMPDFDGIDATKEILTETPSTKVVALSMHSGKRFVEQMLQAGAAGYILKKSVPEDLVNGIRAVIAGDIYLSPAITDIVVSEYKALLSKSPATAPEGEPVPILRTKFRRPSLLPDLVPKTDLVERLDDFRRRPLTLVSGAAGYGKTTLAGLWLDAWKDPYVWLTLDEEDNDPMRFVNCLVAAIRNAFPDACAGTHTLLQASDPPPDPVLIRYLINDLDAVKVSFILVLDDFHKIRNPGVHELMGTLLAHPMHHLHMMVLTRRDPPMITSALRGRGLVNEIGTRDLHFTLPETTDFLKTAAGFALDEADIATIHRRLEGWPAGLRLVSQSLKEPAGLDRIMAGLSGGFAAVVNYLLTEVLLLQPPEMRALMIATAILDRFCAPLCDALKDPDADSGADAMNGDEFIARLRTNNLFLIELDTENRWFRFHHFFRRLLEDRLRRDRTADEIAAIRSRATEWINKNRGFDENAGKALDEFATSEPAYAPNSGAATAGPGLRTRHPTVFSVPTVETLTNRELDVLELLAERLSNSEIAERLFISVTTVKGHLQNIYQKLDVNKRREAVVKAEALGILTRR